MSVENENTAQDSDQTSEATQENVTENAQTHAEDAHLDIEENAAENQPEWPETLEESHALLAELSTERDHLAEKLDKVMRAYAEAENKAKRAEKDKIDAVKYGPMKMARDMLEVADNFERALKAFPQSDDEKIKEVYEGLDLTEKSLHQVLGRFDVKQIETDHSTFDPNIHEAVTQIPVPDKKTGEIVDVIRQGYKMGERLLRPAQVVTVA